jgi:hypothetical protein
MRDQHNDMVNTKIDKRLAPLSVNKDGFVFDPQTGQSFSLNHSGVVALQSLRNGATIEATARALADVYSVPIEVAASSVEAFLLQLKRYL